MAMTGFVRDKDAFVSSESECMDFPGSVPNLVTEEQLFKVDITWIRYKF